MKTKISALLISAALLMCACSRTVDISGIYTADGLDNVYTFTADGKIYVNDEAESYSRYRIEGGKIITYIEGSEEEMSLPFKKTDDGFMMGKLEYRKIPDFSELESENETENETEKQGEESNENEQSNENDEVSE